MSTRRSFASTASAFLFAKSLLGAFRRFCFFLYFIVHAPFVSFSPVRTLDDRETRGAQTIAAVRRAAIRIEHAATAQERVRKAKPEASIT